MLELIIPNYSHKDQWEELIAEWSLMEDINNVSPRALFAGDDFDSFFNITETNRTIVSKWTPPSTLFFIMQDDRILWGLYLRHKVSLDDLQKVGGNIEYGIRPSERGKWYAIEAFRLGIEEAKKIGLEKLLLTCFADNIASAKVIEKNGGIFTKHVEYGGERKRNYLIRIAV